MTETTRPRSKKQVLAFHIKGWKTERDGVEIKLPTPDDIQGHNVDGSISSTIEHILKHEGLDQSHVISITGQQITQHRDIGSWDFWMFCRNPYAE